VLGTLLHEATHGLAHARGIRDTSRQGRYHNKRYAQLATELGLQVAEVDPIGWSATSVPETTAACVCACGRRIRVTRSVLALAPIVCAACAGPFQPDPER
jgi:hypothetical protein